MKKEPQAVSLAGLVTVQPDAVVSKTIIDKKVGTVTVFAFDAGQGLSEHTAPYDALIQVLEGEVEILIADAPYRVKQGEFIILPAHKPHALNGVSAFKMLLTMIRA
jgi:quercetin dioxygenase-like cupin family protein